MVMLLPMVLASNEFGKITSGGDLLITDFDMKIGGLSSRNLDYGDTITRVANPNTQIEFDVEVKNNNTVIDAEEIEMVIQIEDLDLEEITTLNDLSKNNDKVLKIEMTIPSDAEEKEYEILIEVEAEINNTIHKVEYQLDLEVEETEGSSSSSNPTLLQQINSSIDGLCGEFKNYYKSYLDEKEKADKCEGQIEGKDTAISGLETFKTQFNTCENQKASRDSEIRELQSTILDYQINVTSCIQEVDDVKDNRTMVIGGLAFLAIGGFVLYRKKLFPDSTAQGEGGK